MRNTSQDNPFERRQQHAEELAFLSQAAREQLRLRPEDLLAETQEQFQNEAMEPSPYRRYRSKGSDVPGHAARDKFLSRGHWDAVRFNKVLMDELAQEDLVEMMREQKAGDEAREAQREAQREAGAREIAAREASRGSSQGAVGSSSQGLGGSQELGSSGGASASIVDPRFVEPVEISLGTPSWDGSSLMREEWPRGESTETASVDSRSLKAEDFFNEAAWRTHVARMDDRRYKVSAEYLFGVKNPLFLDRGRLGAGTVPDEEKHRQWKFGHRGVSGDSSGAASATSPDASRAPSDPMFPGNFPPDHPRGGGTNQKTSADRNYFGPRNSGRVFSLEDCFLSVGSSGTSSGCASEPGLSRV